jgi:hypothetical protein
MQSIGTKHYLKNLKDNTSLGSTIWTQVEKRKKKKEKRKHEFH